MRYICDFHLHSKYSRATSPQMNLEDLDHWAELKGIQVLGTGDFTHPIWFSEIKRKLTPAEPGLYKLKGSKKNTRFILTAEISCIYSKGGKGRRVHLVIFLPDFPSIEKFNTQLSWIGNLKSDGRPILGADAKDILKIALDVSPDSLVVPAHVWTPWFSVFGSKSGFNSLEECFDELTPHIYAIETGLSSDPAMNWRLSKLDKLSLISCSDAHSPKNLGREATVFEFNEIDYKKIIEALKKKDPTHLKYTIEFFPEEGKYHFDGHRHETGQPSVSFSPSETKKINGICPICGKPLTIGVLNRVEQLADRLENETPAGVVPFKNIVPLQEIIAAALEVEKTSKAVDVEYLSLVAKGGNEFKILLDLNITELKKIASEKIVEGIMRMRSGRVQKTPGYDGVYGKINVFGEDKVKPVKQGSLFK